MRLSHARFVRTRQVAMLVLVGLALAALAHAAETPHDAKGLHRHGEHANTGVATPRSLTEAGQNAFAALSEVVAALTDDPDTDWSRVDIDALREHLVSMNRLVLDATVETDAVENGRRFVVSGEGRTRQAIREMVPAHAAVLAQETRWTVDAEWTADGVTLTVRSVDADERRRIDALGFFGVMATGDHHRPHHWSIATGQPM